MTISRTVLCFIAVAGLVVVVAFSIPAKSSPGDTPEMMSGVDGNKLQEYCDASSRMTEGRQSHGDEHKAGFCLGYIAAVGDLDFLWRVLEKEKHSGFHTRLPAHATLGQTQQVVSKWMKDHPEKLHEPASTIVLRALSEAFPCD